MKTKAEILKTLPHFTGTQKWYPWSVLTRLLLTDGTHYLAESCGAYWLMDTIASYQARGKLTGEAFQVWTLTVTDSEALLICTDGNDNELIRQEIPYTDFPLDKITLWCVDGVILLPSEY